MNKLQEHVKEWVDARKSDYDNNLESLFDDLRYGCPSGIVEHLIYYTDTLKFYSEYKEEINELLTNYSNDTGLSIDELFGELFEDKWNQSDPLALETQNQNLLAWFGFKETAFNLARELGIE